MLTAEALRGTVTEVYTDGGLLSRNPSYLGGTWACRFLDRAGVIVGELSGVVIPIELRVREVTNNIAELVAALIALETVPDGWAGTLYTDSFVTQCRVSQGRELRRRRFKGVPERLVERVLAARGRLGGYQVVLLGGHPSREELATGQRMDGLPCSVHNVWADRECRRLALEWKEKLACKRPV